jgi:hypothetical protein
MIIESGQEPLCDAGNEVFERATKPVKLPDNQAVSRANVGKCFI